MQNLCSVGKRVPKLDAVDKATGRVKYIQDLKVPGMLYGKILYSKYAHAKILKIENGNLAIKSLNVAPGKWRGKTGYFKGSTGGGTSEELNIQKEYVKQFFKDALEQTEEHFKASKCDKFALMCTEENISIITDLLGSSLKDALIGAKKGNFTKATVNEILENTLELL